MGVGVSYPAASSAFRIGWARPRSWKKDINILSNSRHSPIKRSFRQDRTGATAGVREQLMPTRWKQPCVIWEASKLTHLVRLARPPFAALTLPILRRSCPLASCACSPYGRKTPEKQVICAMQQNLPLIVVMLNLFQHNKPRFVILKRVQHDDKVWTKFATCC